MKRKKNYIVLPNNRQHLTTVTCESSGRIILKEILQFNYKY